MQSKYLTVVFDDGPREPMIEIVDKFKKYNFKAGFAVLGCNISDQTEHMLRYAVDNDFQLVCHSQTHPHLETLSYDEIYKELSVPIEDVKKRIDYTMTMARFPHNSYNNTVLEASGKLNLVLLGYGMLCGNDWLPTATSEQIAEETIRTACDGAIACMHVTPNTSKALDKILPVLKSQGYELVTPNELFKIKGINNIPTNVYINNVNNI